MRRRTRPRQRPRRLLRSGRASSTGAGSDALDLRRVRLDAAGVFRPGAVAPALPEVDDADLVLALDRDEQGGAVLDPLALEDVLRGRGRHLGRVEAAGLLDRRGGDRELPEPDLRDLLLEHRLAHAERLALATALARAGDRDPRARRAGDLERPDLDSSACADPGEHGVAGGALGANQLEVHGERSTGDRAVRLLCAADLDEVDVVLLDRGKVVAPERLDLARQPVGAGDPVAVCRGVEQGDHVVVARGRRVEPAVLRRLEDPPGGLRVRGRLTPLRALRWLARL